MLAIIIAIIATITTIIIPVTAYHLCSLDLISSTTLDH
jgi:hypothetical protein